MTKRTELVKKLTKTNKINQKLCELLEKDLDSSNFIECIFVTLKTKNNKQKMIEFLESGESDKSRIFDRTVELNRGINLL